MHSLTDSIILILLIYFFYAGWRKGLLLILLGPIALILGGIIAFVYYKQTQNIIISLLISIIAPFFINLTFALLLKIKKSTDKKEKSSLTVSQFWAGMINMLWNGCWVILTLICIILAPVPSNWFKNMQNDILRSKTYFLVNHLTGKKLNQTPTDIQKTLNTLNDTDKIMRLQSTKEYDELISNPKIHALMSDEETIKQIKDKNFKELLSNPKIQAIMQDPELLKKFLAMQTKMMEMNQKEDTKKDKPRTK